MRLLYVFNTLLEAPALFDYISLKSKLHKCQKKCTETSNCKAHNHLLDTYSTGDLIGKPDEDMVRYVWLSTKQAAEYADTVSNNAM